MTETQVPGQATLPTLQDVLGYGAITHLKPQQETFCWEFILNGSNAKKAYLKGYPESAETSAVTNSSRLLKTDKIQQRIAEIREELQRRYAVDAQAVVRLLAMSMHLDRRLFVNEKGQPLELHELDSEAAAITDIQIVMDRFGKKHAVPVIPERIKAGMELAKIMGITKEKIEVSGINGGHTSAVNIYIPDNGRDEVAKLEELRKRFDEVLNQGGEK